MTKAEALDLAAQAAGWDNFKDAKIYCYEDVLIGIREHAATLMENAALKAEVERLKTENDLMRESLRQLEAFGDPIARDIDRIALERINHD